MSPAETRIALRLEPLEFKPRQWTDEEREAVEADGAPSLYGADYPWI